jgi:hypothetical protein
MYYFQLNKGTSGTNSDPQLEKLKIAATQKIRSFLLQKISMLKKPQSNLQILQQNS